MKQTNWTEATTSHLKALTGLIAALEAGKNAWIELQQNGEQDFPVKIKNPELDNPFNWTSSYGVPSAPDRKDYFNETEKDLTFNWTACFGDQKAIEDYQTKGIVSEGMTKGMGVCHPVKKSDLLILRPDLAGVNLWTTYWKPKNGIPYNVVDRNVKEVYVICTDNAPQDKKQSIESAITFLQSILKVI